VLVETLNTAQSNPIADGRWRLHSLSLIYTFHKPSMAVIALHAGPKSITTVNTALFDSRPLFYATTDNVINSEINGDGASVHC